MSTHLSASTLHSNENWSQLKRVAMFETVGELLVCTVAVYQDICGALG